MFQIRVILPKRGLFGWDFSFFQPLLTGWAQLQEGEDCDESQSWARLDWKSPPRSPTINPALLIFLSEPDSSLLWLPGQGTPGGSPKHKGIQETGIIISLCPLLFCRDGEG